MRLEVGEEQEKGSLSVRVHVSNPGVGEGVHPVTGQPHLVVVAVVDDGVVGIGGELQDIGRQPVLVSEPVRRRHRPARLPDVEVPLADVAGAVTGRGERVRQGMAALRQGDGIAPAAGGSGVEPGLQAGPRRTTHGLTGKGVGQVRVDSAQSVQIGR